MANQRAVTNDRALANHGVCAYIRTLADTRTVAEQSVLAQSHARVHIRILSDQHREARARGLVTQKTAQALLIEQGRVSCDEYFARPSIRESGKFRQKRRRQFFLTRGPAASHHGNQFEPDS